MNKWFFLLCSVSLRAQTGYITALDFQVEGSAIVVNYDLKPCPEGYFYKMSAAFQDRNGLYSVPQTAAGDFAGELNGGPDKRFTWNALSQVQALEGELQLLLTADLYARKPAPSGMIWVEGGNFDMGDAYGEGGEEEKPQHTVRLDGFYMDTREVSFEQFDIFCQTSNHPPPEDKGWGRGKQPVINISWYDAIEYCNWRSLRDNLAQCYQIEKTRLDPTNLNNSDTHKWTVKLIPGANGYRLPTEAEWEYAACERGARKRFGNGLDAAKPTQINFDPSVEEPDTKPSLIRLRPVATGSFPPNMLGLFDLSGNVWEWCTDWYGSDYYSYLKEENSDAVINPAGPNEGLYRVIRGGAWNSVSTLCRASARSWLKASDHSSDVGFRCVKGP